MNRSIVVCEPIAALRSGLNVALVAAGFVPTTVQSLADVSAPWPRFVVTYLNRSTLPDCIRLAQKGAAVLALTDSDTRVTVPTLISAGIQGVLPRGHQPAHVAQVLDTLALGLLVLPADTSPSAAQRQQAIAIAATTTEQRTWLSDLAAGLTVREIAERDGHSERTLHRRLQRLYNEVGATNLVQAVAVTAVFGIVSLNI